MKCFRIPTSTMTKEAMEDVDATVGAHLKERIASAMQESHLSNVVDFAQSVADKMRHRAWSGRGKIDLKWLWRIP